MFSIPLANWKTWLDTHCSFCGHKFGRKDINGGRCWGCNRIITSLDETNIQAYIKYAQKRGLGPK